MINNKAFNLSLNDTTELRKLIIENPDLPLLIFAGEDACHGFNYEQAEVRDYRIKELTLYENCWHTKDYYRELLINDLCKKEKYKDITDKEYYKMIDKRIENTEFCKAIVIYVG